MKSEKESSSFGRYLQEIRLEKQIGLEKISEETRIALRNLRLIEKEDLEKLPDEVYVAGFLRAYARAIGADGDEAVRLYRARLKMKADLAKAGSFKPKSSWLLWRNLVLSLLALTAMIVSTIYITSYFQKQVPVHASDNDSQAEAHVQETFHQSPQSAGVEKSKPPESGQKLVLNIRALEDTWVKVIIDNHDAKEYDLKTGEELEIKAIAGYNLLIGNAGGLELLFNGEPVKISGKVGEVVNLQLP